VQYRHIFPGRERKRGGSRIEEYRKCWHTYP
jgi:hypothetical protein